MHITSAGTMDKPDQKIRRKLAESCDGLFNLDFGKAAIIEV
jgi:hypothetical protein